MQRLTQHLSLSRRTQLSPLMEASSPPPVPPKDQKFAARMEVQRPTTTPTSGSKRKRDAHLRPHDNSEAEDPDVGTPKKRSRPSLRQSDASASEDATPAQPRSVRRKKGSQNLSTLNLRHSAKQQEIGQATLVRESKFQEGSLTDKPSDKPPSIFTRSTSYQHRDMDELMEDYLDGVPTPRRSLDNTTNGPSRAPKQYEAEASRKDEGAGLFQFGRSLAASFNPTSLWRKLWNEPKEETIQEHMQWAESKAKQKIAAEVTYAQMKQAGQLGLQPVAGYVPSDKSEAQTPRDSGVEIDGMYHSRRLSHVSEISQPLESESEATDTACKPTKSLKSKLHLKKPSLTNIKSDLKRVGSDFNLTATLRRRESSSSLSPVKRDFDSSALRRSESRYDLSKKHLKLQKRVSDLESKLAKAREAADAAWAEASPAPRLTEKYERFRPSGTIKRPRFIPGKLPSLPSERILMAQKAAAEFQAVAGGEKMVNEQAWDAPAFTKIFDEEGAKDDTIKASRANGYPNHASSLFNVDDNDMNQITTEHITPEHDNMDINPPTITVEPAVAVNRDTITSASNEAADESKKDADYALLDAKLKALDKNAKIARKPVKSKKRKSGANDDDKLFKPGKGLSSDDDAEWEEAQTSKKKRKSAGGGSPPAKRNSTAKAAGSPKGKKDSNGVNSSPKNKAQVPEQTSNEDVFDTLGGADEDVVFSADEAAHALQSDANRMSVSTEGMPLDVVYEEEEETSKATRDGNVETTTKTTTTRVTGLRSRSNSPHKRSRSVQPAGGKELMLTRAAEAVKASPARRVSPPLTNGVLTSSESTEVVKVKPGDGDVPTLPNGATGSFESLVDLDGNGEDVCEETIIVGTEVVTRKTVGGKSSFEWPEDVF